MLCCLRLGGGVSAGTTCIKILPLALMREFCQCDRCDLCRDHPGLAPSLGGLQLSASFLFNSNPLLPDGKTQSQAPVPSISQTIEKHKSRSFRSSRSHMEVLKWMQRQEDKGFTGYANEKHHFLHLSQQFWLWEREGKMTLSLSRVLWKSKVWAA